jgi:hypothetical protein
MKYFYLVLTLLLHFLLLLTLKLLDNPGVLFLAFFLILFVGLLLYNFTGKQNKSVRDFGWGLLFGSLTTVVCVVVFMIWLTFNFPR